jgi:lipid-binding SYLF domain-containing protein
MRLLTRAALVLVGATGLLAGCSTASPTREGGAQLIEQATAALKDMNEVDDSVEPMARKAYAYAVFPEVIKGGLVFGGAHGQGVVYEQGEHIGYAELIQGSFGLQAGGQRYRELILFENKAAIDRFKRGPLDWAADASAVFADNGAAANARFVDGIAVIVTPIDGAMAEAAVAGQQFRYTPKSK